MNSEIENLINIAILDGELTEKEKEVILRKATVLGEDIHEVEMILNAKLYELKSKSQKFSKNEVEKCPSCGEIIIGLSKICSSCGYHINKRSSNSESINLNEAIHQLENLIIEVKSMPPPKFSQKIKTIIYTYFSFGLYLLYRKLFKNSNNSFETLIAKCEKESRTIKIHYGEDKKVRILLEELRKELDNIINKRKKDVFVSKVLTFSTVSFIIVIYILFGYKAISFAVEEEKKNNPALIDSLMLKGDIKNAKIAAFQMTDKFKKKKAIDNVISYEVEQLILQNKLDSALSECILIDDIVKRNELKDRILILYINKLLANGKYKQAEEKAFLINNLRDKNEAISAIQTYK